MGSRPSSVKRRRRDLPIQPCGRNSAAVVAELMLGVPRGHVNPRRQVDIVLLDGREFVGR